jgi:Ca2+-binding RTX toxin-like protein
MSLSPKWAALSVALASIALLVGPAPAGAAVVPVVQDDLLTVTGDGDPNLITLTVIDGEIAVDDVKTGLLADGDADIVVNSGGGNDTVDATALVAGTYQTLVLNGGDDDDVLRGGAVNGDVLNGEAGNDTLVGGRATDTANGGDGDDVMVWNNGDNTDVNNGAAGNDEVVINGNDGGVDVNTYAPDPINAGRAIVARTNVGQFTVNFDAERLTVNGLGGDDAIIPDPAAAVGLAERTSLVVNGGADNDTISGGDGNDRLVGGTGADAVAGGPGDDLMVWNNGDGSDSNEGGDGIDTVQSNGNPNNEAYRYGPGVNPGEVHFERLPNANGLGAFTIDLVAENLVINSLAGEDTFQPIAAGLAGRTLITVNAGDGTDSVTGGDGNDTLNGDAGNDMLIGGRGNDTANGGADDDLMVWNNGDGSDVNNGGDGTDTVQSNGNPNNEEYRYAPGANAGEVHFERLANAGGLGAFSIDLVAENLVVNSLAGDDNFRATAPGLTGRTLITVNAGEGNDDVEGGDGNDTLNGDLGNDLLVGAKGADTANGGDGDDLMVWNNGDGSDVNNGDLGNDTVRSNGNPNDESYTYKPGADAGRVLFERAANAAGAGAFAIDLSAENLEVNSLAGADTFRAPNPGIAGRTLITVNAGDGNDDVEGGDGGDVQNGDAGNDRLVGAKGGDSANGGDGDDLMVWNNGDGSDVNNGNDGNDTVQSNGAAVGETYTYEAAAARVLFKRVSGAPAFQIDFTAESLVVNALAGDDRIDPLGPLGGLAAVTINAGDGNDRAVGNDGRDTLDGGAGDDTLFGGEGNDNATGGAGSDLIDGQDGNDGLQARDGENDLVRGGAGGGDTAVTDALTVDSVTGVETLDAIPGQPQGPPNPPQQPPNNPPAPPVDKAAQLPTLGKFAVTGSGGKLVAKVPVSCPAGEAGGCRTTLTVETAKAVRLGSVRAVAVLGSKSVQVAPGGKATASIRIARNAATLAVNGKLAVRVRIVTTDAAGNTATRTVPVTLKVPRS